MLDGSTEDPSTAPVQNPVVFQCANCLQIVADSTTWLRATPELRTFTLLSAPSDAILLSDNLSTSHDGHDLGSTYAEFSCSGCSAKLGRIYRTTPRYLDDLRDNYTFDTAVLKNYQLGADEEARQPLTDVDLSILHPAPDAIAQRLAIMETVIMSLHDKIEEFSTELAALKSKGATTVDINRSQMMYTPPIKHSSTSENSYPEKAIQDISNRSENYPNKVLVSTVSPKNHQPSPGGGRVVKKRK
ncbi:yippee zinc-binding/DNA-binding /Mis18, centromere assembly-domain-containing protein [Dipodascopsis uninucleata]